MAVILLLIFSFSFLQSFSAVAQTDGKIIMGASLSAAENSPSWLSPSGDFAFGFCPLDKNNELFLLSIWYDKIPTKTIVWYTNGDKLSPRGSKVQLTADRGLVLQGPQGEELWRSENIIGTVAYGFMNNTGNFELLNSNSVKSWESFRFPADTVLPSQTLERGELLSSKQSETNFSKGRFRMLLESGGNLVLNTINLPADSTNDPYFDTRTTDSNSSGYRVVFNESGNIYLLLSNDRTFPLTSTTVDTSTVNFYYRAIINFDGVFTQYQHPKNSSSGSGGWKALWSIPDNICTASLTSTGSGTCGFNSICRLQDGDKRPICSCPEGYVLSDPNDKYGDCKPNYTQSCADNEQGSPEDIYDFEEIINTDWPTSDYALLQPFTEEQCRESCLHDCMCAVAIFRSGDMCWKKKLPLSNGRYDSNLNGKALIKISKATAQSNGTVSIGQYITAADNSQPWLSDSRDFAFGFHQLDKKDLFLPAIWYYKIPSKTIVWYASADNPASAGSKLQLTADRGLALDDPNGKEIWKSDISKGKAAFGLINDAGNFLITDANSEKLWQSFDHPTDTLLPTQKVERNWILSSRLKENDLSRGRFQFRLLQDGNAVLNTINLPSGFAYDAYFWSNTFDVNRSNAGYQVVFDESGYLYVLKENKERVTLTPGTVVSANDYYCRATLNFDGVFMLYSHPKITSGDSTWTVIHTLPENICINDDIRKGLGSGICGYNSICSLSATKRPICECPKGFSLLDPDDANGSCKPDFIHGCAEDRLKPGEDLYYIEELKGTDWPISDYEQLRPSSREECMSSCLKDCLCSAAVLRNDTCWKKKLPLSYGKMNPADNGTAFIKIRKGQAKSKKYDKMILVGSVLFGSSAFLNFILVFASCLGFIVIGHKKSTRAHPDEGVSHMNLRCFTYKELVHATHGFKEELGRGAYGIVYKGFMEIGPSNLVAVKKLDRVFQDSEKEFEAEVNVIGRTHHKNLVRLLGFCDDGPNRLIVYEFLRNGTLASFLFGDSKPNWKLRTEIAVGIARGLLYLHEECCTPIIHCDIKPQNILLDDYYNARISDFGLAKLLTMDQSHTSTTIRGTKGYVAPEWFRNIPVTVKVDLYSFGVVLLEIICLRRCVDNEVSTVDKTILTDWAYDRYQEGALGDLVGNDSETLNDMNKLQRFVMVALWCIQEDPSFRPTMRKVIQMLEGVTVVPVPPCPWLFKSTSLN